MDKETLSNYGWIVVLVLILAVMLALATPFGTFVADAVKATTAGFFSVNQNAMGAAGITIPGQEFESCEHDYEVTTTANCTTAGTTTHTCKLCGKSYSEEVPAGHKYDNTGLTCTECGITFREFAASANTYDSWMGTTTRTDAVVEIPETFTTPIGGMYKTTSVATNGFKGCANLKSVTIPESVTKLNSWAFGRCSTLTNVNIPDGVTSIDSYAFYECFALTNIDLSRCTNLISIGDAAFTQAGLTYIVIPDSVTSIGKWALQETKLTSITIPANVTIIDNLALADCSLLTSITFKGTMEQWNAITFGSSWNRNTPVAEVICSDGTVSLS